MVVHICNPCYIVGIGRRIKVQHVLAHTLKFRLFFSLLLHLITQELKFDFFYLFHLITVHAHSTSQMQKKVYAQFF
jgi:hypothetical protein